MDEFQTRLDELKAEAKDLVEAGDLNAEKVDRLRAIRTEITSITDQIAANTEAAALQAEIEGVELPVAEVAGDEGEGDGGEGEKPAEDEKPAEEAPAEAEAVVEDREAIAAAMGGVQSKDVVSPDQAASFSGLTIVASSSYDGLSMGQAMDSSDMGRVFKMASGSGEGTVQKFGRIDRAPNLKASVSSRNASIDNTRLMSTPQNSELMPLTAAACFCGPFETMKDIRSLGNAERPVAGMFRQVAVTGPFRYVQEVVLADVLPGVNQWTCAEQALVDQLDPGTWKQCIDLDCATEVQVDPYAVVACGIVSTHQELSHPELVDDFVTKLGINYSRVSERLLLDQLRADATVLTHNVNGQGLVWELIRVLGHLPLATTYNRRLDWTNYQLAIPQGVLQLLVTDELMRGFSMDESRAEAKVLGMLGQLGYGGVTIIRDVDATAEVGIAALEALLVNPGATIALDGIIDAILPNLPVYVVPTAAYSMGMSTVVEAGWRRDNQLIRQNQVEYFYEGMEFLEKMTDIPSFVVELTGGPNGGRSALTAPPAN